MNLKSVILSCVLCMAMGTSVYALSGPVGVPESTRGTVNEEIIYFYNIDLDYFTPKSSNGLRNLGMVTNNNGRELLTYFVYGSPFGKKMVLNGEHIQYLGYTKEGGVFENPMYPWSAGWSGTMLKDYDFVYMPWQDDGAKAKGAKNEYFNALRDAKTGNYVLEANIQKGLDYFYGGKTGKDRLPAGMSVGNRDKLIHTVGSVHKSGRPWAEFVYVTQPPTNKYWGTGIAYIRGKSGAITYITIPIAPHDVLKISSFWDEEFTFSTFSNYEINQSKPMYDFTFYIADFDGYGNEEEFYIEMTHHMKDDWVNAVNRNFTLSLEAGKSIDWYTYEMSATPVLAIIYRKDKERSIWGETNSFDESDYVRVINGKTYYYYNAYYYKDGMRFVSKNDLATLPVNDQTRWLKYLGFTDGDALQKAISEN